MHTSQPNEHPSRTKQSFQSRKHENTAALPLFPEPEALQARENTTKMRVIGGYDLTTKIAKFVVKLGLYDGVLMFG